MAPVGTLLEIAGRVAIVYVALLVMLRVSGRRELAELSPVELLTLLLLSETVSPAMTGGDETIVGGLTAAGTLLLLSVLSSVLVFKSRTAERWIEGTPAVLISAGRVNAKVLRQERMTADALHSTLRERGVMSVRDVAFAFVEADGHITIIKRSDLDEARNARDDKKTAS
jgi:uncharacterized membrane protein YcaP (DUF421 family)